MTPRRDMDVIGALSLTGFALFLAFNQVVIKLTNEGLQPVFFAALRSFGAAAVIYLWMRWRGRPPRFERRHLPAGTLMAALFAAQFTGLFLALDLTSVTRTSIIFYTMPVWLALAAHLFVPGERLTAVKLAGLLVAFTGMAWAMVMRPGGDGDASVLGDLLALGAAMSWAGIALCTRITRLSEVRPEMQLFYQLALSGPMLLAAAFFFGPFLRAPDWTHWAGLGFQIVAVASAGFLFWLWLLSIYKAGSVAAFSFLSPVFGVLLGWLLLNEAVGVEIWVALALVCGGLFLINRPS